MDYWLRRVIFEDIWERQTDELIALCGRAQIDGVLLMEQSHMALMSPYPIAKHERMAEIYRKMAIRLKEAGIRYGINIASLVGHTDMEVPDEYRMDFQKFVGDDGREAAACYCILDERWQEYASEVLSLYAATGPECIFLDDDFRSLNHGRQLGCFCPIHLDMTARRLGKFVTAEEILASTQARTAWMEANYEGQKEAVLKIEEAVHSRFPEVRLGLMSSDELRHSLQGRHIEELLLTLAGPGRRMLYRPTGAIYGDAIHKAVFEGHQRMALTMGEIHHPVQVVSELELFPHTRFSCSRRFSEIMMRTQILAGACDITLNLYDYLGNPVEREPIWEKMLKENKQALCDLAAIRKGKRLKGFGLLYRMTESRYKTMKEGNIASLYPDRNLDLLLPSMGIPVQFTQSEANAVIGEAMWCYSEEELRQLLAGGFLTDARGAQILWQRGFGEYLGCRVLSAGDRIPAMERLTDSILYKTEPLGFGDGFRGDILPTRWNLFKPEERFLLEPVEGAAVFTTLLDLEKRPLGAGTVLYHNPLGGTCAVLAVSPRQETWCFPAKAYLIHEIVNRLSRHPLPVTVPGCPNLGPVYYEDEDSKEGLLAVLNGSLDSQEFTMKLHGIRITGILEDKHASPWSCPDKTADYVQDRLDGLSMRIYRTERI